MPGKRRREPRWLIQSRVVYDHHPKTGKRYAGGKVVWGEWQNWDTHAENKYNFRDAVRVAKQRLAHYHRGSIVYIRRISDRGRPTSHVLKLFQAKWGHDDQPFIRFDGTAGYWWGVSAGLIKLPKSTFKGKRVGIQFG